MMKFWKLFVCTAFFAALSPVPAEHVWAQTNDELDVNSSQVTVFKGVYDRIVMRDEDSPSDYQIIDARDAIITGYPEVHNYPFSIGKNTAPKGLTVLGGTVIGTAPLDYTWQQMKSKHDGPALWLHSTGEYTIDGLRAHNVEDGIRVLGTTGSEYATIRNVYLTYIRDDVIENNHAIDVVIEDSLFDGVSMGFSQRPNRGSSRHDEPTPPETAFVIDRVLLRLEPMPYRTDGRKGQADGLGNGQLFKWSEVAGRPVIRDSIFMVERRSNNMAVNDQAMDFPRDTIAENVTLIWLGEGDYPGWVPEGVTITDDRNIWDEARAKWLERHGYPVNLWEELTEYRQIIRAATVKDELKGEVSQ